ncbi:BQ5605_C011g06556 [Microbotryum silenes-dioicae]|uniref:BQ5605_C011g06556 protein n=1 Tax=Microbotryum silenes-dioicae TaxID=796604 RepID=A0A2X0LPG7_9BASI|nr:BQ5605_C011g06556 [Microbotryum silenes-dioicae]
MTRRLARIAAVRRIYSLIFGFTSSHYVNTSRGISAHQHNTMVHNHRPKLFNSNWTGSSMYLISLYNSNSPAKLAQTHEAESIIGSPTRWGLLNTCILPVQSDSIIVKEMKRTKSAFVSSHDMAPEVLASDQIDARLDAIVESNSFISGRIRNLLSHCGDPPPVEESNCDKLSSDSTDVDMEGAQEDSSGSDAERGCFSLPRSNMYYLCLCRAIMGQIAFACNRRNNAMQRRNGLMALACGANDRLTTFLYDCGLTTSRRTTRRAALSLTMANLALLKEIRSTRYFHVTLDNIDVAHHVNDEHLDRRSEPLHGTLGYAHVQNGDVANAYDFQAYIAHQALLPPVDVNLPLPAEASEEAFATGFSAQMYRALARLVPHLGLTLHDSRCRPEPIEQLDVRKPDITLLQMMDESDTSPTDVAKVINRLRTQLGLSEKEKADSLWILGCDGGTSMLVEDYNYRVPGVAHLQWIEISRSLFITANLLGRKGPEPQKIKDYNPMERLLRDTAQLELLSCLLQTHLTGLDVAIMKVFDRYLHSDPVQRAKVNMEKAPVFYESLLRLRDLVDFEEAYYATLPLKAFPTTERICHTYSFFSSPRQICRPRGVRASCVTQSGQRDLLELIVISTDRKADSLNSIDGDRQGVRLTSVGVCTGMVDHEGGSDVVDWRCGPKVRPVRPGWLIHVGAKNRPSGSVRKPAPSRK